MEQKDKLLEEDLYSPVKSFFEKLGYKVNGEVKDCDITAVKDEELIIVELKRNLTVSLLAQAVKRQKTTDLVYVAVPKPKNMRLDAKWKDICHLLRRLELGILLVSFKKGQSFVEVLMEPAPFDRDKSKRQSTGKRRVLLKEIEGRHMDLNKGGSRGKKLVTAYRESAIFIAYCLDSYGPMSPKKLRELGSDGKKTLSILSQDHYGWFNRLDRGIYGVTEKGKKEIKQYGELVDYFKENILKVKEIVEK